LALLSGFYQIKTRVYRALCFFIFNVEVYSKKQQKDYKKYFNHWVDQLSLRKFFTYYF